MEEARAQGNAIIQNHKEALEKLITSIQRLHSDRQN